MIGAVQGFLGDRVSQQTSSPRKKFRTRSPADALLTASEPSRLPLTDTLPAVLEVFQREVTDPSSKEEADKGPMETGRLFKPQRKVEERFFKPLGHGPF